MVWGVETLLHSAGAMSFGLQAAVDASVDAMLAAFEASVDASVAWAEARVLCLCICVRSPAKVGNWYEIPLGPRTPEEMLKPSQELMDLVQMATIASRHQAGELIWVSWVPAQRRSQIGHGSTLVMLTSDGACKIACAMQRRMDDGSIDERTKERYMKPAHFDVALKDWLMNCQAERNPIKYCYVYPPIGNFKTHLSGCEVGLATGAGREDDWEKPWACPGTRKSQDPKGRDKWLARLTKKGEPTWIVKFDLDQESARHKFMWCSCWAGPGYPPMPRGQWLEAMGANDERAKFAREGHKARLPGSEALVLPWILKGPAAAGGEPKEVAAASSRDGAQGGADLTTASKKRTRVERNMGHHVFQRTLRFWVYRDSGTVDAILTDELPAASVKELESRGLLFLGHGNMNWQLGVNAPRARDPRADGDAAGRSSEPAWRAGPPRRDPPAEDSEEQEGGNAAASSSSRRPTSAMWSPRRRT